MCKHAVCAECDQMLTKVEGRDRDRVSVRVRVRDRVRSEPICRALTLPYSLTLTLTPRLHHPHKAGHEKCPMCRAPRPRRSTLPVQARRRRRRGVWVMWAKMFVRHGSVCGLASVKPEPYPYTVTLTLPLTQILIHALPYP